MNEIPASLAKTTVAGFILGATFALEASTACAQSPRNEMSFSEDIAPIFRGYCESCHKPGGEGYNASGLDLTSYDALMKGAKFGAMVVPRKPDESNLIVLLNGRAQIRMPLGHKPLPNELLLNIWSWIFQGARNN